MRHYHHSMRGVSRIDSGHTHCYTVRVGCKKKPDGKYTHLIHRTFTDNLWGGRRGALRAAKDAAKNLRRRHGLR